MAVLAVDCQSTGANPARGHLLEIGWAPASGAVESHLVALPEGERVPPQVARVTGIQPGDLADAIAPSEAWRRLRAASEGAPVAVIHFARFERAFLGALHQAHDPEQPFPLEVVCTHEIAARLLPELPRRGLHALAGYFGMAMPKVRRCADHVAATVFVWRHLVERLANRGVTELDQLAGWLRDTPVPRRTRNAYPMSRARRLAVPEGPGVYRMLRGSSSAADAPGEVLYVGKARSLRRRVNSYFQKQSKVADHTLDMLTQARDLHMTETATALEAALLETDEIKRCAPPYNIALVDECRDVAWVRGLGPVSRPGELRAAREIARALDSGDATRVHALFPELDALAVGVKLAKVRAGRPTRFADLVVRAQASVRRAQWFARLANATVSWRLPAWDRTRVMVVRDGHIVHARWMAHSTAELAEAGASEPGLVATYDRLRVLTTEMRRVLAEGGEVCIDFPRRRLSGARLERTLRWV